MRIARFAGGIAVVAALLLGACRYGPEGGSPAAGADPVRAAGWVAPGQGWVLTERRLLTTRDGGRHWADATPEETGGAALGAVHAVDGQRLWAASLVRPSTAGGRPGLRVYRSPDGGSTWVSADVGLPPDASEPLSLAALDHRTAWVAVGLEASSQFRRGLLWITRDGGATWRARPLPTGGAVLVGPPGTVWLVGGPVADRLYASRDGGERWQPWPLPPTPSPAGATPTAQLAATLPDGRVVLALTVPGERARVHLYTAADRPGRWEPAGSLTLPVELAPGVPAPVAAVDGRTWLVVSPDGSRAWRTRDGGRRWEVWAPRGLPAAVTAVAFADADRGWAVVRWDDCPAPKEGCRGYGWLYGTEDGGRSWTAVSLP